VSRSASHVANLLLIYFLQLLDRPLNLRKSLATLPGPFTDGSVVMTRRFGYRLQSCIALPLVTHESILLADKVFVMLGGFSLIMVWSCLLFGLLDCLLLVGQAKEISFSIESTVRNRLVFTLFLRWHITQVSGLTLIATSPLHG
jgi:hypothetical protein